MTPNNLRIGFDAKRAVANNTGLGNYSRLIVDRLAACYPGNEYILLSSVRRNSPRLSPVLEHPDVSIVYPSGLWKAAPSLWRSGRGIINAARSRGVQLFHGLAGELPVGINRSGMTSVVTIHDLIFNRFPQGYKPVDRKIYDHKARLACNAATRIIAISERTRRDIIEYYGTDPDRIDVVYQGCDDIFRRDVSGAEAEDVARRHGLTTPYFITVGTVEERKNQLSAIKALESLPEGVSLAIVGRYRGEYGNRVERYIEQHRLGNRVKHLMNISFEDLALLTGGALASIYPSRYEGFGIPVIEALSAGTPVIAATGSCLEEAGGPGAIYLDPDDIRGIAGAMTSLHENPDLRRRMVAEGREYIVRFDNRSVAANVMDVYRRALEADAR